MFERREGAAVEQVGLDVMEVPFDLPLGLGAADAAGLRAEAVVRGEGEELRVVQRSLVVVPQHDHLHVVVQADAGHAAEMMEGADVLAQRRRQILRFDEAQVLAAGVAEQVTEEIDAAAAFAGEVEIVDAEVHLGLVARPGLEARHGRRRGRGRSRLIRSRTVVYRPVKPRACSSCRARSPVRFG